MLLDPLEKQLDLPAALVQLRDGQRGQQKVVGEEYQVLLGRGIVVANAAQPVGIELGRIKTFQANGLIATQAAALVDRIRTQAVEAEVFAGADDEEGQGLVQNMQPLEIQIGAVHDVDGTGFDQQLVEHVDLVDFRGCHADEGRNIAVQIQQRMHLHGRVLSSITRPGEQRKTEIDGGAIQRVGGLLQLHPETFVGVQRTRHSDQDLSQIGINAPVAQL